MSGELWQLGALELAAAIRKREVSSREVIAAHLARIDEVNPALNAIVRRLDEDALAAAAAADRAIADDADVGPLHGVPCTVKENIDLTGTPTTQAITALADAVASTDAPVVERLRAAGAIPIGRTNLPDLGLRVHTDSSLHGLTRNPWSSRVTAGGSSGGEAAALASGMSPLGLGNDIGGSLRNPAHCCGIASIKPTTGVVPHATEIPPIDLLLSSQLMMVEGVMARSVADVAAGFAVVAGAHRRDPLSLPIALPPAPDRPLRVALLAEPPGGSTDAAIAGAIRSAADALAAAGHDVIEATPPSYEQTVVQWAALLAPDLQSQRELLDAVIGADGRRFLEFSDARFAAFDTSGWPSLFLDRYRLANDWEQFFHGVDVLLSPTWTSPPFEHGADVADAEGARAVLEMIRPVIPANFLGLPATVAPAGVVDGLPVGAHFTAARFADLTALAAAAALEAAVGTFTPIDHGRNAGRLRLTVWAGSGGPAGYRHGMDVVVGADTERGRLCGEVRRLRAGRPLPAGGRPGLPVRPAGGRPAADRPAAHRPPQRPEHRRLRRRATRARRSARCRRRSAGRRARCPICPSSCAPASTRSSPPRP